MSKIRVRFAPSPTGFMHVGNFRSALYDYLFSKKNKGSFILRIEDTDQKRFVPGALESLLKVLDWAGIKYHEGPYQTVEIKDDKIPVIQSKTYPEVLEVGEYGPYVQSEKLEIYKKHAEQLVKEGKAYYCFCTPERLEEVRAQQIAKKKAPKYDRHCLSLSSEEIEGNLKNNLPYVIRLKMPENENIEYEDIIRGHVSFNSDLVDDQVLMKSDGFPTYHLANVIDDHDMQITHVIRGEEWLPSLPKHITLYKYFGWDIPQFAHLPLLLNPDKTKLSKRQGDVAVEDYIKKGYLKEAIINFVALLGWNPGKGETQEIFTLEELIEKFDFAHVHKAGAVFDLKKLDWINQEWIKKINFEDLFNRAKDFYLEKDFIKNALEEKRTDEYLKKVLTVERDRLSKLAEVGESNKFFFLDISYDKNLLCWKESSDEETRDALQISLEILNNISENDWNRKNLEALLLRAAEEKYKKDDGKIDRGALLWPLRAALTGEQKSPSPFEVAWVLGKEESLKRINDALDMINQSINNN